MIVTMTEKDRNREIGAQLARTMKERLYGSGAYKELHDKKSWVNWHAEWINGEWKKVPYNPRNGHRASSIKPETWGHLPQALARLSLGNMNGIGLMVSKDDPYLILDVDERQDKLNKNISGPLGREIFSRLQTITEFSPNYGLHFLVKLEQPLPEAVKDEVEMYYTGRYMTVTADLVPGSPLVIATRQTEVEELFRRYKGYSFDQALSYPQGSKKITRVAGGDAGLVFDSVDWRALPENHFDDERITTARANEEVLRLAKNAANRENFLELWENRWRQTGKYRDRGGTPDDSRADMALVKYLLYWTGGHKKQTNDLFEESSLMRSKWRDRVNSGGSNHSYGEVTIRNCVEWLRSREESSEPAKKQE